MDDRNDNFYHEREILKARLILASLQRLQGWMHWKYLKSGTGKPDLIFLDINNANMGCWAFSA